MDKPPVFDLGALENGKSVKVKKLYDDIRETVDGNQWYCRVEDTEGVERVIFMHKKNKGTVDLRDQMLKYGAGDEFYMTRERKIIVDKDGNTEEVTVYNLTKEPITVPVHPQTKRSLLGVASMLVRNSGIGTVDDIVATYKELIKDYGQIEARHISILIAAANLSKSTFELDLNYQSLYNLLNQKP